jgi:Ca2+-transporting ATPase
MNNNILKGLSENEVIELRKKFGENKLSERKGYSFVSVLFSQFKSPLIYILFFAMFISLIFKEYTDILLIGLVVVINVIMGFYQEYKAQRTLTLLKNVLKPMTLVIRGGKKKEVGNKELVPGDLVVLTAGDRVPADGKVVESLNLMVQESVLTGEESAVGKSSQEISSEGILDKSNLLFMGTTVIGGRAMLMVTQIGDETEIGKIGKSLINIEKEKTPLQIKLEKFSQKLAIAVAVVCVFIFIAGILHHENIWQMFKLAVVLSVAAIPEGLPMAVTIILSLGMKRILKRKGLVKRLISVETLGSTSVICTDKTGTITEGKMQVARIDSNNPEKMSLAAILNNNQKSNIEICLWNYIREQKLIDPKKISELYPRIYEEMFDSEKKYSFSMHEISGNKTAFFLGAPEIVLNFCNAKQAEKNKILLQAEEWASEGLKILGAAFKEGKELKEKTDYCWLGLIGIQDPIRPEVKESVAICQKAGIKIKIITGDHLKTAESVALNIGLKVNPENILSGHELEAISDDDLRKRINEISLFVRVSPHQKLKIVKALQDNGEVVAMTGDGVNDVLALKKANIGIAVENATDIAKEVSDLILLDSNFKTIVAACEEGRLIFSNIKKVIGFVLSNSFAEIILISGAILLGFPAPLTVAQILWIHLVCDGPPDILLGFEPKDMELSEATPQQFQKASIFDGPIRFLILSVSLTTGLLALLFFWQTMDRTQNLNLAQTITFATIASASLIYIFTFKNLRKSLIKSENFFKNKLLFLGVIYGYALILVAVYLPQANKILGTVPLKPIYWLLVLAVGVLSIVWIEAAKLIRKKNNYNKI